MKLKSSVLSLVGFIIAILFALVITPHSASAAIPPEMRESIYRDLQEPTRVKLQNGRTILGYSIEVNADQVKIGTSKGAGEAIFTFHVNEIKSFTVPGENYKSLAVEWMETGDTEHALDLMEMLFQQRSQMIPLLPPAESHFFIYYIELILDSPNPARTIGVSSVIRPQIEHPAALRVLDDAVLESYNALELHDEARALAEAWVAAREPYDNSALGYYVLAAAHFREKNYEMAIEQALQPIVFSSPVEKHKLAHCYAVAIAALNESRDKEYARKLYKELKERKLDWPKDDRALSFYYEKNLHEFNKTETDTATDPAP